MSSDISARRPVRPAGSATPTASGSSSVRPDSVRRWARAVSSPVTAENGTTSAGGTDNGPDADAAAENDRADSLETPATPTGHSRPLHRLRGDALAGYAPQLPNTQRGRSSAAPVFAAESERGNEPRDDATAPRATRGSTPGRNAAVLADTEQTLPLMALRGRHGSHREARNDADSLETLDPGYRYADAEPALSARAWMLGESASGPAGTVTDAGDAATSSPEQLQSLIASCCDRLWVSDGANGVPQGLMLDLGRWMPGCTLEVAKAAGGLRISMRGVDSDRAESMEKELADLGDDLAGKLGCRVVVAVERHKKYPG